MAGIYSFLAPQWTDTQGGEAQPYMTLLNQTPLVVTPFASLLYSLQALSACTLGGVIVHTGATFSGSPSGASSHPQAVDQLRIQLAGVNTGFITVPGPIDAIFSSGGVNLNTSNTLVQSAWTQIQAILGDYEGNPWTTLVGGVRRRVNYGGGASD